MKIYLPMIAAIFSLALVTSTQAEVKGPVGTVKGPVGAPHHMGTVKTVKTIKKTTVLKGKGDSRVVKDYKGSTKTLWGNGSKKS
jgi:hypothetical protein